MKPTNKGPSVHIVQHLRPGGIESLALEMLRTSSSNDIYILSLEGNKQEAVEAWPRLEPFAEKLFFLEKGAGFSFTLVAKIRALVCKINAAVVHSHHIGPLIYSGLALKGLNLTHIHTEHDAWHLDSPKHQVLEKVVLKLAKPKLVADAELVAQKLQHHFPSHKISTITNGIDCNKFKPRSKTLSRQLFGLPQNTTLIGSAGRLETVKGHALLIKAMRFLPPNISLAIAGSGSEEEELRSLVSALALENRVHFLGQIEHIDHFYSALDLFCQPSQCEGFPLATLEAQSCGCCTVATDVGATYETLAPQGSILVRHRGVFALAHAITSGLHGNTNKLREYVQTHHSIHTMAKKYTELAINKEYA